MILYHGTSTRYLDRILRNGILPRRSTRRKGNWDGKVQSKPGFVYLTTAYPVYYAQAATDADGGDLAIIKVDAGEAELYPDEDFVARAYWELCGREVPLKNFNPFIDPANYKDMWEACLEYNGTACTPSVPASRIIGHRTISSKSIDLIWNIGGDGPPVPLNYQVCGKHYERCIEALFQGGETAAWQIVREHEADQYGESPAFTQAA